MNKDKQIQEMVKDINEAIRHNSAVDLIRKGLICVNGDGVARELFDEGYCKQSEVVKEFLKRFEMYIGNCTFTLGQYNDIQYALKKATKDMEGDCE